MNSAEILDEQFRSMFSDYLPVRERPIDPPYIGNTSLDLAMKRLRTSLTALNKSEFWDDFVLHMFDEITDAEADSVAAALLEDESLIVHDVMLKVKERAIRITAEQYIDSLGAVS